MPWLRMTEKSKAGPNRAATMALNGRGFAAAMGAVGGEIWDAALLGKGRRKPP